MTRWKYVSLVFVLAVVCMSVQPAAAYYCYYKNDSTDYNFYTFNDGQHYTLEGASSDTGILKAKGSNTQWDGVYTVFEEVGMMFQPSESGRCKVGVQWQANYHIWVGWGGQNQYGVASITVKYVLYRGTTFLESRTVFTRTANSDHSSITGTDSRDESTWYLFSTSLSPSYYYTVAVRLEFSMNYEAYIQGITSGTAASVDVNYVYVWNTPDNP